MVQRPAHALRLAAIILLAAGCGTSSDVDPAGDGDTPEASASSGSDSIDGDGGAVDSANTTETTLRGSNADDSGPDNTGPADTAAPTSTSPNSEDSAVETTISQTTTSETTIAATSETTISQTTTSETTAPPESGGQGGSPAIGAGPIDAGLQPFVDKAVAHLADTQAVSASDITVESAQIVQWPDASAGCPQPGMQYAQVITDGSAIRLTIGGANYWYHTGGANAEPTLCTSAGRQSPP